MGRNSLITSAFHKAGERGAVKRIPGLSEKRTTLVNQESILNNDLLSQTDLIL